jgi:hypothetical protein
MIKPLSDELDGWLSTIFLFLRHVEIINEDNESLAWGRAINTLSSLIKLFIKGVLCLICRSLGRECEWNSLVIFI